MNDVDRGGSVRAMLLLFAPLVPLIGVFPLSAQRLLPPDAAGFELPIAAPRGSGFVGQILSVSRGESSFGAGIEGDVVLGESLPLIRLGNLQNPITVDFSVATQARFSLSDSKSALISNDWTVGFGLSGRLAAAAVSLQLFHESSHLGDEYAERFDARRIDWTREVMMLWVGVPSGPVTIRAALGSVLLDQLGLPRALAALALDYRGRDGHIGRTPARAIAGIYTEGAAATRWRMSTNMRFGVELGLKRGHRVAFALVAHDGLSTQRQFFRAESRYVGADIRFDL